MKLKEMDAIIGQHESRTDIKLPFRVPMILRLHLENFKDFKSNWENSTCSDFQNIMCSTAEALLKHIDSARFAYVHGSMISLFFIDGKSADCIPWFEKRLHKIVSAASSIAGASFLWNLPLSKRTSVPIFTCAAFTRPLEDVEKYFLIWQQDVIQHSIFNIAVKTLPREEIQGKSTEQLKNLCLKIWKKVPPTCRFGAIIRRAGSVCLTGEIAWHVSTSSVKHEEFFHNVIQASLPCKAPSKAANKEFLVNHIKRLKQLLKSSSDPMKKIKLSSECKKATAQLKKL